MKNSITLSSKTLFLIFYFLLSCETYMDILLEPIKNDTFSEQSRAEFVKNDVYL